MEEWRRLLLWSWRRLRLRLGSTHQGLDAGNLLANGLLQAERIDLVGKLLLELLALVLLPAPQVDVRQGHGHRRLKGALPSSWHFRQ